MFVRVKGARKYRYLQLVENRREGDRTVQRVLCTLGRVEDLETRGGIDVLLRSLGRFGRLVTVCTHSGAQCPKAEDPELPGPDARPASGGLTASTGVLPVSPHIDAARARHIPWSSGSVSPSNREKAVDILRKSFIFSGLDQKHLIELSRLVVERELKAGQFLFFEGQPVGFCHLVASGVMKLVKHSASGVDFIIDVYGRGEMMGITLLFAAGKPHTVSAQAVLDARVLSISSSGLIRFLHRYPAFSTDILGKMLTLSGQRYQADTSRLTDVPGERTEYRLARVLWVLCRRLGPGIPLTRREIAEMTGTTIETTSRFISRLKRDGIVRALRGKVVIVDHDKLGQLAGTGGG
ncbi:MAG: Crp/Fnr family transcriptional regulator [Chloroflexi bacterium]|nr:Crp/Fnr family transcriptional regulator [Chloroflexota bacterium]